LVAWGSNTSGQTNVPAGVTNVIAISAGVEHNVVLKRDGTVQTWGGDEYGQLDRPAGLSNVVAVSCGGWHTLALKNNGTVVAWGAGAGSNANVDFGQSTVPAGLTNVVQVAGGWKHSLALVGGPSLVTPMVPSLPVRSTNGFSVTLPSTRNGRVYQLEFKNSLTDSAWQSLPLQAGTGGNLSFVDPAIATQRYYRVVQW